MSSALKQMSPESASMSPWVKAVLNGRTPQQAATELITGSKLAEDPAVRKALVDGGQAAIDASTDSLVVMALKIDPIRREQITWFEKNVQSEQQRAGEKLARRVCRRIRKKR